MSREGGKGPAVAGFAGRGVIGSSYLVYFYRIKIWIKGKIKRPFYLENPFGEGVLARKTVMLFFLCVKNGISGWCSMKLLTAQRLPIAKQLPDGQAPKQSGARFQAVSIVAKCS